mmetsp:Transcript_76269/g.247419  ORF Transcript_76269/g.247419 Transcript_76269/m.247419 type:complete len:459 (+) Transcript_76269:405-1781(+)
MERLPHLSAARAPHLAQLSWRQFHASGAQHSDRRLHAGATLGAGGRGPPRPKGGDLHNACLCSSSSNSSTSHTVVGPPRRSQRWCAVAGTGCVFDAGADARVGAMLGRLEISPHGVEFATSGTSCAASSISGGAAWSSGSVRGLGRIRVAQRGRRLHLPAAPAATPTCRWGHGPPGTVRNRGAGCVLGFAARAGSCPHWPTRAAQRPLESASGRTDAQPRRRCWGRLRGPHRGGGKRRHARCGSGTPSCSEQRWWQHWGEGFEEGRGPAAQPGVEPVLGDAAEAASGLGVESLRPTALLEPRGARQLTPEPGVGGAGRKGRLRLPELAREVGGTFFERQRAAFCHLRVHGGISNLAQQCRHGTLHPPLLCAAVLEASGLRRPALGTLRQCTVANASAAFSASARALRTAGSAAQRWRPRRDGVLLGESAIVQAAAAQNGPLDRAVLLRSCRGMALATN